MDVKLKKGLLFGAVFTTIFMGFLLYRVEWRHFTIIGERMQASYLFIAFGMFMLANYVRAYRFSSLDHRGNTVSYWWNINHFYNFINATLPGGAGEVATAYVLKRYSVYNLYEALKILLLTRVHDLAAVSGIFFGTALMISSDTAYRKTAVVCSSVLFLVSLLALAPAVERFFLTILDRMPGRIALFRKLGEKLKELAASAADQQQNGSTGSILFQSVLANGAMAVSVYFSLLSFGIDFHLLQGLYCFGVFTIFKMIPVQGVAGLGTQAAWWSLGITLAGYDGQETVATGFVLYGIYYVFIGMIGFPSMIRCLKGRKRTAAA